MVKEKMIYNNLILNKNIFNQLQNHIKTKSIPNAFLFYGDKGSGKIAHAIEFSATLLCDNRIENKACSSCTSCKKIKKNMNENIEFIMPLPKNKSINRNDSPIKTLTDNDIENIKSNLNKKLLNPYHEIKIDGAKTILINSIREIKKNMNLSNLNNKWKIYIMIESEKMCFPKQEAANAMLKILEEPKKNNLFILITSNISNIINTIKSRCLKLHFKQTAHNEIENYLTKNFEINSEKSKLISKISNRNISLAMEMLKSYDSIIKNFKKAINIIYTNNIEGWMTFINKLSKKKNDLIILLDLLEIFYSDLMIYQKTRNVELLKFYNFKKAIHLFSNTYNNSNWEFCVEKINNTKHQINNNANLEICLISLIIELNKISNNEKHLNYGIING
tara:strand:+ start:7242 stop:8414 length:1173 start_codon:yes stop_codon:yes gene_type:complete